MSLPLQSQFEPHHGLPVPVAPNVVRITAPNASPFTFHGTNSYLVGRERLVLVDPGPADERHKAALEAAIDGRPVDAILVTHTHLDHTGLARPMADLTGAPLVAEGPHRAARPLRPDEANPLDAAGDKSFRPDIRLGDGETLSFEAGHFTAVATPGHTANHLAYALEETGVLFSGDHVMAWSTTIVAPPDGSMADFMRSLDKLLARADTLYLPGHGGPVERPGAFVRALRTHRRMREASILDLVRTGERTIPEIVADLYRSTDPKLHGAAGLSVFAHLEDLAEKGQVVARDGLTLSGRYAATSGSQLSGTATS
jgi:glyoxylase-like metal-dependent hydrolase (beta-lactamase superfamily II)